MKRTILASIALICVLGACEDDPKKPIPSGGENSNYRDLTDKTHVLHNLRQAYNDQDATEVVKLLDEDNFTFYFYEGDVGGIVPVSWGYPQEVAATQNLLGGAGGVDGNAVLSIDLTLFDFESATWVDGAGGVDGNAVLSIDLTLFDFESATWVDGDDPIDPKTTIVYDFYMDTENDVQWITSGAPTCEFTVREIDGTWKLIEWRDSGSPGLRAGASTEEISWGKVKALYQPE